MRCLCCISQTESFCIFSWAHVALYHMCGVYCFCVRGCGGVLLRVLLHPFAMFSTLQDYYTVHHCADGCAR